MSPLEKISRCALLALFAVFSSMVATSSALAASHTPVPDFTKVDAFITIGMQEKRIPGAEVAIVENDQVVHLRGFGRVNDAEVPVTPQTPFMIGSSTKSLTALAVMQLVEAGKVQLDTPVQRTFPGGVSTTRYNPLKSLSQIFCIIPVAFLAL